MTDSYPYEQLLALRWLVTLQHVTAGIPADQRGHTAAAIPLAAIDGVIAHLRARDIPLPLPDLTLLNPPASNGR